MLNLSLSTIAKWVDGQLIGADNDITGVSTDTRSLQQGDLFVALKGERFDAHEFIQEAFAKGARACLVERSCAVPFSQVVVPDTECALGDMARQFRATQQTTVVGVTGSNGKTTVKNLIASILRLAGRTHVTAGNFNNEIGLPLTLLSMAENTEYAVLEMGAGKPGDIAYLTAIAQPNIGLVNNVAPAHLERLGSLQGVAKTKGAIYSALPIDGIAIINADDAFASYFTQLSDGRRTISFGVSSSADVSALIHTLDENSQFTLRTPVGEISIALPLLGQHNVQNALAASAVAFSLEVPLTTIKAGLEKVEETPGRLIRRPSMHGWMIIDDTYNANPGSMTAAIQTLTYTSSEEHWLVLGDMKELGEEAERLHAHVGTLAKEHSVSRLFTVGTLSQAAAKSFGKGAEHFFDQATLIDVLKSTLHRGVCCLIKGSHSSAMDQVVEGLLQDEQTTGEGEKHHVA